MKMADSKIDLKYRPDVDGLRAVAVCLVILFHCKIIFPGGFIGVDVFFVVSGYLITGVILKQRIAGEFSLRNFWVRRIRRIVPAAAVMVLATLVCGSLIIAPDDLIALSNSAVAHQLAAANIYFWKNTGYFARNADVTPLLHTWSLGVEEQFYFFYPFVLVALCRLRSRSTAIALVCCAVVSLAISEWGVRHYPGGAFYLLPSRAWELLMGGLIWFVPGIGNVRPWFRELSAFVGLLIIVVSGFLFDEAMRFPGIYALIPCIGTAIVISAGVGSQTITGRVLALRPIVFVGLISYSLYLWHWPILAFTRYWMGDKIPPILLTGMIGASFLFAFLSWRFVEKPLRRGVSRKWRKPVFLGTCATVPLLLGISTFIITARGFPARFNERVVEYRAAEKSVAYVHEVSPDRLSSDWLPTFGDHEGIRKCLVWGDSHAMSLMPGINDACKELRIAGFQATHSMTAPLLEYVRISRYGLKEDAPRFNENVIKFVESENIDVVILACMWSVYASDAEFEHKLQMTIDRLNSSDVSVILVLDVAQHFVPAPTQLAWRALRDQPTDDLGVPREDYASRNGHCNSVILHVAQERAIVIDPAPFLVDEFGIWRAEFDGVAMYRDRSHLTIEGGLRLAPMFKEILSR